MTFNTIRETLPSVSSARREIPYNYTSAGDRQAISFILGEEVVRQIEELRDVRVTGRSARLLMQIFGDILIHGRNPYLFQELLDSEQRRKRIFDHARKDIETIETAANGEGRVMAIVQTLRTKLEKFRADIERLPEQRRRLKKELSPIVGARNVLLDPFSLVAHATDATDWRLYLPVAVVTPEDEVQVAPLIGAIARLGLRVIPRGAGTGLTGGAVPLRSDCVIINTERLNRVRGISQRKFHLKDGHTVSGDVIELEAGVITETAMHHADEHGLVFATDPTSEWACTIGGNISENAGGKMAVRWGTCIDNLLEWKIAMPGAKLWTVRRTDHQLRKILPEDVVTYEVLDQHGAPLKRIALRGTEIRKQGLWKDITNKALGGVPGLQKEGTDGVITSAVFVLYPKYEQKRTLCLEFFGPDMEEASKVIVELSKAFPYQNVEHETLLALEHFDDEYIRAIDYKVKASRPQTPRAVLLIDIAGHNETEVEAGVDRVRDLLDKHPNTLMFVARDKAEATLFWTDRKKLGAIARRTNAFKLNEDIVIPIDQLAVFARFIDDLNVEEERYAQEAYVDRIATMLHEYSNPDALTPFESKIPAGLGLCDLIRTHLKSADILELRSLTLLQEFKAELKQLFRGYPDMIETIEKSYQYVRDRRIVLATHMHAGDGNVHVNVPVLSNDRPMLDRADHVIDMVMEKVISLGGVVSGEHGIGVTKLRYMDKARIEELSAYRREVDPDGIMNPGKLEDYEVLNHIFTPSFNLLELEAHILRRGKLEALSKKVDYCIRCGKCKPDCCVYYPARGMFYHPRNKNLAIGSLIEALLYDAQRERSTDFELLQWLEEVSDHCTICHKCLKPCPVDIDTGEVSILEREILSARGYKDSPPITTLTLDYLANRSPFYNKVFRNMVLRAGGAAQRAGTKLAAPLQNSEKALKVLPPLRLLRSAVPPVPEKTLRDVLPACDADQVLLFEPEGREAESTVLYFPGCGSERLHSSISMASIHILLETGTRVVLPPPFLCCGFPLHVNAKSEEYASIVLRNTVMFSQIRDMFSYMNFNACVISCGTCLEGLTIMDAPKLFGGRIVDVSRYAYEKGLRVDGKTVESLYHAPCHDSLGGKACDLLRDVGGFGKITEVPHCCSEAGSLALSRPDITDSMLQRKREALKETMHSTEKATILTNCPSCVQGLGRNIDMGVDPKHIAVALAEKHSGNEWMERFLMQAAKATAVIF
jgi:FAD/FMN-containing dehydrogenase/Fe-S oxidoreductase